MPDPLKLSTDLFFYGTLRAAEIRKKVLGYDVPDARLLPARLQGFEVRRVSGAFYPMIVASATEDIVEGLVMTAIDSGDLDRLDRFEGEDYQRIHVLAEISGQPCPVQIYQASAHLRAAERWDFRHWYENELEQFLSRDFDLDGVRKP